MPKSKHKLVRLISFIGLSDLWAAGIVPAARQRAAANTDPGPIWRFVSNRVGGGILRDGDNIMLLDDQPENDERRRYVEWLGGQLGKIGADLNIERLPLEVPGGPTNLERLYRTAFKEIPADDRSENHFLLSPGTPAMYATLVLASEYLNLKSRRLFESSEREGVVEVRLPYDIGLRPRKQRSRTGKQKLGQLLKRLPGLQPDTVADDPAVRVVYAALRASSERESTFPILIHGARGTGKMHAARQLASWRNDPAPLVTGPDAHVETRDVKDGKTVIVCDVQGACKKDWSKLRQMAVDRPKLQFVFLWRDGEACAATVKGAIEAGLAPGGAYQLPLLTERDDHIALVECFAKQAGMLGGKVRDRFKYTLVTNAPVDNLHALRSWVSRAAAASTERHVSKEAVEQSTRAMQSVNAQALLDKVLAAIANRSFVGRVSLDTMLRSVAALTVQIQEGMVRGQQAVADGLGEKRSTFYDGGAIAKRDRARREVERFLREQAPTLGDTGPE